MLTLIIDTSTEHSLIAIANGSIVLSFRRLNENKSLSSNLLAAIKDLLVKTSITLSDIKNIAIANGPGSFTSLRIGAAIAHSFVFSHSYSLLCFSSLMSFSPPEKEEEFFSFIDAKRNHVYFLQGERKKEKIIYKASPKKLSDIEALSLLKAKKICLTPHKETLEKRFSYPMILSLPCPNHLSKICHEKVKKKEFNSSLKILYLNEL